MCFVKTHVATYVRLDCSKHLSYSWPTNSSITNWPLPQHDWQNPTKCFQLLLPMLTLKFMLDTNIHRQRNQRYDPMCGKERFVYASSWVSTPQPTPIHTNSIKTHQIFGTHFLIHTFLFVYNIPYLEITCSQHSRFDYNPQIKHHP